MKKSHLKLLVALLVGAGISIGMLKFLIWPFGHQILVSIPGGETGFQIIVLVSLGIFLFNWIARYNAWFKPYFISKYNILTTKIRYQQEFDFSRKILFDKLIEVVPKAGFKIIKTKENTGDIFATSSPYFASWGENIYINLKEVNGKTIVDFCSACSFLNYSLGKNKSNYENFLKEFEESLII